MDISECIKYYDLITFQWEQDEIHYGFGDRLDKSDDILRSLGY